MCPMGNKKTYADAYKASLESHDLLAEKAAELLSWNKKFNNVYNDNLISQKWFYDGELNACYNAVDRHRSDKTAIIYSDNANKMTKITYNQLYTSVNEVAAVIAKANPNGAIVTVYLPHTPVAYYTMLACARLGFTHNVVFGGYSSESLRTRLNDSKSELLVTCYTHPRESKRIEFLKNSLEAAKNSTVKKILIFNTELNKEELNKELNKEEFKEKDLKEEELMNDKNKELNKEENKNKELKEEELKDEENNLMNDKKEENLELIDFDSTVTRNVEIPCTPVNSEHPLFTLYTSGSTGKPKGVVHSTGGYLLWAALTMQTSFEATKDTVMLCTADVGWITGHSYSLYAPLVLGCTTIVVDGSPLYPTKYRIFEMIEKCKVSVFFTAPTVIRLLQKEFLDEKIKYDFPSLRFAGSVGEPLNREAHAFYSSTFKVPVVDTYFQTETGGFVVTPVSGFNKFEPESAGVPMFGLKVVIKENKEKNSISEFININGKNEEKEKDLFNTTITSNETVFEVNLGTTGLGEIFIDGVWPGVMREILNDRERYLKYFKNGLYVTGDEGFLENGNVFVRGRADDVLNVAGHRFSTAEIESAVCVSGASECAVVGIPDRIVGEAIIVFYVGAQDLTDSLRKGLRRIIGPICYPKRLIRVNQLPKTRTGKIMRRVLKAVLMNKDVGDVSTCANVECIDEILSIK